MELLEARQLELLSRRIELDIAVADLQLPQESDDDATLARIAAKEVIRNNYAGGLSAPLPNDLSNPSRETLSELVSRFSGRNPSTGP